MKVHFMYEKYITIRIQNSCLLIYLCYMQRFETQTGKSLVHKTLDFTIHGCISVSLKISNKEPFDVYIVCSVEELLNCILFCKNVKLEHESLNLRHNTIKDVTSLAQFMESNHILKVLGWSDSLCTDSVTETQHNRRRVIGRTRTSEEIRWDVL